jgi:hypothetical protein
MISTENLKLINILILQEAIWLLQEIIQEINKLNFKLYAFYNIQFSLANVVPQNQYNNGGIWNSF